MAVLTWKRLPTWAQMKKSVTLLRRPNWRRGLLQGVAATVEHLPLAAAVQPKTVIDVGANKGQFSLFATEIWPTAEIYAFEPLHSAAAIYKRVTDRNPRIRLFECAIGPKSETANMHVSWREDSSSLLPMTARQEDAFPGTSERTLSPVQVRTLQECVNVHILERPILFKVDVQGYELEVLRGCCEELAVLDWLYVECSEVELYVGQALRPEIEAYLARQGFHIERSYNSVVHPAMGLLQSDVLFRRS